jgi:hypothetical protein
MICGSIKVSFAQYKITGMLADTVGLMNLGYSSVSIMSAQDSLLQDYTRANEDGIFELEVNKPGDYFIRYAHPSFTTLVEDIHIKDAVTNLDTVHLITLQNLLEEVIVRASRPITIKGDTIEYTADSFQVSAYATVDELLRKLPGIEIDKNGKIKAQGQDVKRMLVDGDEFFSDDPAVVAKMLKADVVDKVQVFDHKSEEAKITGIDDAEKSKTINLTLKENAKQGYMGKLEAGAGPPKYYEGQAMINAYKKKRKIAGYFVGSNTNNQGLGWNERNNYGANEVSMSDDGNLVSYSSGNDNNVDWNGRFGGQGLPKAVNGGLSYNNKFGKDDKLSLSGSYRFSDFSNTSNVSARTQYFMPDTQYVNNNQNSGTNRNISHNATTRLDFKIDSSSNLNLRLSGGVSRRNSEQNNLSNYTQTDGTKINESTSQNNTVRDNYNFDLDLNYNKKFKKTGRSFTANFSGKYGQGNAATAFLSSNTFFLTGNNISYNQEKIDSSINLNGSARFTFTEPLIKEKLFITLAASSRYLQNDAQLSTYDNDSSNGTRSYNSLFSSDVNNTVFTNVAGATLRFSNKVIKATLGGNINFTDYQNTDRLRDVAFQRNYTNFFPQASIRYSKKRTSSYSLNYNGATNQPRLDQIQVMVRNTDPLNIRLGNQNLVQEFRHNFSASFNTYKLLADKYTYGNVSYSIVQNAFSEARNINAEGVNTYQTININGNWNINGYLGYGMKIKPIDTRISLNLGGFYGNNNTILNNLKNNSKNININLGLNANYHRDTGISIAYEIKPAFNINQTSVYTNAENRYWMLTQDFTISYKFGTGLAMGTTTNWMLREKMDANDQNNNIFLANIYLSKTLLKDRSLVASINCNDIFNKNVGFNRSNYNNYIMETKYDTIRRYILLKLSWNFTKSKSLSKDSDNAVDALN